MTSIKVTARTFENQKVQSLVESRTFITEDELNAMIENDTDLLSGKAAGVCYAPDDYFSRGIQNEEIAVKRAGDTSKSGHHSVFEHMHFTLLVKTSKMMCMILNSMGVYATSEKSARYTIMKPETELEAQLYDKWKEKIRNLIIEKYPDIDDKMLQTRFDKALNKKEGTTDLHGPHIENGVFNCFDGDNTESTWFYNKLEELKASTTLPSYKLAQENARYMISVFAPTFMEYTVSYRQYCLIEDYLDKLIIELLNSDIKNSFRNKLLDEATKFNIALREAIKLEHKRVYDNKNQYIRFLQAQHRGYVELSTGRYEKIHVDISHKEFVHKDTNIADSYTLNYKGSLAMLAQLQRHRTLRYQMFLEDAIEFYVPEIIKDAKLEDEWLADIKSVGYCIPQGTLVDITEQGLFEDFVMKCKERLCGCAQLEIMFRTKQSLMNFISNKDCLSEENQLEIDSITNDDEVIPRCMFKDFKCTSPCRWGAKNSLTRLV